MSHVLKFAIIVSTMLRRFACKMACEPHLVFISGNASKVREVQAILEGHARVTALDIDLPEYQGEPEDIVREKGLAALKECKKDPNIDLGDGLITEDTSLCFNALGGMPGPYVKWFLQKCGASGLNRMLVDFEDKTAYAQCTFAFCRPTATSMSEIEIFTGKIPGSIVAPRGKSPFGWDPIFLPDGYDKTFSELEPEVKNKISHRFNALKQLKEFLDSKFPK